MSKSNQNSKRASWYRDGLRFTCTQCGICCGGEPGFVWVNENEIEAIAKEMAMDVESFEQKFIRIIESQKCLNEYPDGDCILLDRQTRKCTVYGSRPIQCRLWPFWDSNLKRRRDWEETCDVCPGAGVGMLYTFEQIEVQRCKKSV